MIGDEGTATNDEETSSQIPMIDDKDTASFLKFSVVYGEEDRLSK
jgi:hypothetical protein